MLNSRSFLVILYIAVCVCREGNGTPLQYSCLENPMDGGVWWAAVHEVTKSWTRLRDFTLTSHFNALEKEMATHSSVLAWRIPGTGERGGLLSVGSHRVRHNSSDLAAAQCECQSLTPHVSLPPPYPLVTIKLFSIPVTLSEINQTKTNIIIALTCGI